MQCTQYTIADVPSNCEAVYLSIVKNTDGDRCISLSTLLGRFVDTVEDLTICNPHTDIRLVDSSILGTMKRLTYLNIDTDSVVEVQSLKNCTELHEVYLHNCSVDVEQLPSSISTLYLESCDCTLDNIAAALPKIYSLVLKNIAVDQLPDMSELEDLTLLKIIDCAVTKVHDSFYGLGLEVLEIVHSNDTELVLKGSISSQNIDSIVLYGNIVMDSMSIEHRPSNVLIRDNSTATRLPTMKKGTELIDVRYCPNIRIYAADLHNNVDRLIVDSHKYLNADEDYRVPIQIVNN